MNILLVVALFAIFVALGLVNYRWKINKANDLVMDLKRSLQR